MKNKFSKTKKIFLSSKHGFSLMELLLVVAITLIATAAIFSSNNSKKASSEVESAARQVAAHLRSLQNEALAGKQIGASYIDKFVFTVASPTVSKYKIAYYDDPNPNSIQESEFDLEKKKVSISPISVSFTSPFGKPVGYVTIIVFQQMASLMTK
ncbi:MAG: hypothetical protein US25_C0002G0003 [Candidatus Moranbacteria bacterium GW2011_GWE1_36_7]|nr:MAG: hypothetical protein US25_C0002G0003 [Candidatus Moranbacteria bacterium GW2011_GWE1_36_7]